MNFTSTSDLILKVENLSLSFRMEYFKEQGLRDTFVSILKSPAEQLLNKKDQHKVLDNISFKLRKGERLGIMGLNGAGKTTLSRCINGMIFPDSGTINVYGTKRAIFNANIAIHHELTGRENAFILAALLFPEINNQKLNEIVEEAIIFSDLGHFIDIPFKNYSKGMQARLCLSVASAMSCDLLLLDEVYDGADELFRRKITERVHRMIQDSGAVILISHNHEQIKNSCNRLIILNRSQIEFDGDVEIGIQKYQAIIDKMQGAAHVF